MTFEQNTNSQIAQWEAFHDDEKMKMNARVGKVPTTMDRPNLSTGDLAAMCETYQAMLGRSVEL